MPQRVKTITPAPAYLQFYPTLRCNLSCEFCFNRGLTGMMDVDPDDFQKIVAAAAGHGIGHIDFLGGEPTLHPDIADMIAMIESAGLMTTLSSNGTHPEVLARLSRRFPETALRIGVSVNTASIGSGLLDYIKAYRPIVKTLFSGRADVFDSGTLADIQAMGVSLRLIYKDALNEADLAGSVPFEEFYRVLSRIKSGRPNVEGVYCSGFLPEADFPALRRVRCPAGTTKLAVLPDGSVYPCYLLFRDKRFRLGNLLEDDFSAIWENSRLDYFRSFEKNGCPNTGCDWFGQCHGGCPAAAWMFHRDLSGPDPRCCGLSGSGR